MSTLRALSVIYLLCALAFSTALVLDRNPALNEASRQTVAAALDATRSYVAEPAAGLVRDTAKQMMAAISGGQSSVRPSPAATDRDLAAIVRKTPTPPVAPKPVLVTPRAQDITPPDIQVEPDSTTPPPRPELALAPPPPSSSASNPADIVRVTMRLRDSLTREMFQNFSLFLYVSKASNGPWAQHMYVFTKDASGNLALLHDWPASTGRERNEIAANGTRQPSVTPRGYYELDPGRMYKTHFSGQWHEPMPHAMFFNWEHDGLQTGLAIHGAVGIEIAQLGSRASAGCIRIAPENAAELFSLIRAEYKGLAPRFAYDRRTATMSNDGLFMHDAAGNLQMAQGYKVLVFVENYGGENVVAALF
jgi:hypothetical protein